ncbi:MAG: RNA polymerase sigma factor [Planctomycetota bacterium]
MTTHPPSDDGTAALTRAIASGDTEAFARLYDRSFDRLLHAVRRDIGRDEAFCLDVVQDTFMKVIRSIPTLQTQAQLDAWLRRTLLRTALDAMRRERRRSRRESAHLPPDAPPVSERIGWLEQQLQTLADEEVGLIIERYRFGWTLQRIGAGLGISAAAAHARINRILRRLRDSSGEDGP